MTCVDVELECDAFVDHELDLASRGFHVKHWIQGGMSFWTASDLNDAELSGFVRSLQASQ